LGTPTRNPNLENPETITPVVVVVAATKEEEEGGIVYSLSDGAGEEEGSCGTRCLRGTP
jgi:hypothetical protein